MKTIRRSGQVLTVVMLLAGGLIIVGAAGQTWASTIPLPTPGAPPSVGDSHLVGSLAASSAPSSSRVSSLGSATFAGFSGRSGAFTAGPGTFAYVFQPEITGGRTDLPPTRIITVTSPSGVWTAIDQGNVPGSGPSAGSPAGSVELADTRSVTPSGVALLVVTPPGNTVSWNFSGPPPASDQPGPVVLASLAPGPVFAGVAKTRGDDGGCDPTTGCPQVPEPGTLLLVGSGLVGVGIYWRRKLWFSGGATS